MTKLEAITKARLSSQNGYVQHVNRVCLLFSQECERIELDDNYTVSDWCDDTTVASYENGKELSYYDSDARCDD